MRAHGERLTYVIDANILNSIYITYSRIHKLYARDFRYGTREREIIKTGPNESISPIGCAVTFRDFIL